MSGSADVAVRQAREADVEPIASFTQDTWYEFERGDYIPDVFPEWVRTDGPDQRTVVGEVDGAVVGCCQVVLLSEYEAWAQGIRVRPDHRGTGVGRALDDACAAWARDRGATVLRNMVFSWNEQGLAAARTFGYWGALYDLYKINRRAKELREHYESYPDSPVDLDGWQTRRDEVMDEVYAITGADPKY